MPEEKKGSAKKAAEAPAKPEKGSLVKTLGIYGGLVVVAAVLAVVVFLFFIKPKLTAASGDDKSPAAAKGHGKDGKEAPKVQTVQFDQAIATVLMPDPALPASLLAYQVSMECANQETADLVKAHKSKLAAMLSEQHSFRHRAELNDPQTKRSIEKVALQKANDILQQYLDKPDPNIKILDIYHESFVIEDK